MESKVAYITDAPLSIAEERATYVRSDGTTYTREDIYVKLYVTFRDEMLTALKGPPLSVYLCIALHCGKEEMTAYPSIATICEETGYSNRAVITAAQKLQGMGLIEAVGVHKSGSNIYRVRGYAAMGKRRPYEPSSQGGVNLVHRTCEPSSHKEDPIEDTNKEKIPAAPEPSGKKSLDRMRTRFGPTWDSVARVTQEAQSREGNYAVPVDAGGASKKGQYMADTWFASKGMDLDTVPRDVQREFSKAMSKLAAPYGKLSDEQACRAVEIVLDKNNPEFSYYTYSNPSVAKFKQDWGEVALRLLNGQTGYLTRQGGNGRHDRQGGGMEPDADLEETFERLFDPETGLSMEVLRAQQQAEQAEQR